MNWKTIKEATIWRKYCEDCEIDFLVTEMITITTNTSHLIHKKKLENIIYGVIMPASNTK